jgi:DNA-binding transcriptional regulator PaaX
VRRAPKGLDFLQLEGKLLRCRDLTAEAKLVLAAPAVHLSSGNGRSPSVSLLSQELGLSKRSVVRIVERLEGEHHLSVARSKGRRNAYSLSETRNPRGWAGERR